MGILDIPKELEKFSDRIIAHPFAEWTELPEMIASIDINLAPLEESIFNEAKSENKWVEAALVRVPTVATNLGAFQRMIEHGRTGILCDTVEDWYTELENWFLVMRRELRLHSRRMNIVKRSVLHCTQDYLWQNSLKKCLLLILLLFCLL